MKGQQGDGEQLNVTKYVFCTNTNTTQVPLQLSLLTTHPNLRCHHQGGGIVEGQQGGGEELKFTKEYVCFTTTQTLL